LDFSACLHTAAELFSLALLLLFQLSPLVPSLQPYSRPLPSETALLKVSDVPSNLGRHKWEERDLSQSLFQRSQSCSSRNWGLLYRRLGAKPLIAGRGTHLGVYPISGECLINEGVW